MAGSIVTLAWTEFACRYEATGHPYLSVNQTFMNLPPHAMSFPIVIILRGTSKMGVLDVNPTVPDNIRFYLDLDKNNRDVAIGDTLRIPSGAVTWIAR